MGRQLGRRAIVFPLFRSAWAVPCTMSKTYSQEGLRTGRSASLIGLRHDLHAYSKRMWHSTTDQLWRPTKIVLTIFPPMLDKRTLPSPTSTAFLLTSAFCSKSSEASSYFKAELLLIGFAFSQMIDPPARSAVINKMERLTSAPP